MYFSNFIPYYGNKNINERFFVHFDNTKKELKFDNTKALHYYYIDGIKNYVKISGSIHNRQFKLIVDK